MGLLQPFIRVSSIYELTIDYFRENGISYILVDLDNTLLPWESTELSQDTLDWVDRMRDNGLKVCVITNSKKDRATKVMSAHDIPVVWNALKPFPMGYYRAGRRIDAKKKATVVIGDQLFTDVMGANIAGYKSILVEPFSSVEYWWTRFARKLEKVFARRNIKW